MRSLPHRRRARWAAPVAVAGAIALGSWVATTGSAQASTPNLPKLTAAQILAKAAHPTTSDFSGTVKVTANLDLPDVSSLETGGAQGSPSPSGFDPTTFLSGTHQVKVWAKGDDQRLSYATTLAETDLVHAGNQAWLYDSSTQKVTHWTAPTNRDGSSHDGSGDDSADPPMTPVQAAQHWLDHLDPSTTVTVSDADYVAHRAAYNLTLSPKAGTAAAATSTLKDVSISVDAATGLPLCVQMDAKGQSAPALMLQFSNLDLDTPAVSNFDAPHGTSTKNVTPGTGSHRDHDGTGTKPSVTGGPWTQVLDTHVKLGRDMRQLDKVSTSADGGRLIHTAVGNALVLPDGRLVVGFVTPAALEAAAG